MTLVLMTPDGKQVVFGSPGTGPKGSVAAVGVVSKEGGCLAHLSQWNIASLRAWMDENFPAVTSHQEG